MRLWRRRILAPLNRRPVQSSDWVLDSLPELTFIWLSKLTEAITSAESLLRGLPRQIPGSLAPSADTRRNVCCGLRLRACFAPGLRLAIRSGAEEWWAMETA